ncbi:lipase/esterase [Magnaporthiopsis poae ATCC 64411]|uniref:Lipase/esterase n=1 Tax=Magnaporthiopsis poae (strain ATCC 64411 / 73-15) TaxID=644358 RepID=A0A0C4EEC0_MAGP6|nr:lipase/esterase [Magnaporthiopsis poae ATCC 64411]
MNTATVSLAVTPTVVSTLVTHYLNRKPLRERPTAHLPYHEGLHLIRSFLLYASHHTVEELQAFTAQWVPHPQWVKVEEVKVPEDQIVRAASLLEEQLGPEGIRKVGGSKWWQWRKPDTPLRAEWIEMRADHNERKKSGQPCKRIMLYIHGGAYYFGSVDEHRYQLQRHARKLKARVIAPRYRLSPQFPFPCGLHDCLATYLHLLESGHEPNTIIIAGDSAGGGMALSILVTLRDRGIPLPAGAVLISPWVDLTHSFPSVGCDAPFDYIPQNGFHHKPSEAWPPPTTEQLKEMHSHRIATKKTAQDAPGSPAVEAAQKNEALLSVTIDGKLVEVEEQIQMYTTNDLLSHPLVSPIMQPTLGGLPPLFIMTGGGEILRDEQIYLAHKCADPEKYLPADSLLNDAARELVKQFKPTDVQLQVWDDMCHVGPTLAFTRPAKYMYRSIAQFGAWALARAQRTEIDILDDDDISVISSSGSDSGEEERDTVPCETSGEKPEDSQGKIGKAGDPLPEFKAHMIRQRVTRHGDVFPLAPPSDLPGCCLAPELVGVAKETQVRRWLEAKKQWDTRYASAHKSVHKKRLKNAAAGYESFGPGEHPPPSALAGRRKLGTEQKGQKKRRRSMGLALWSLWGSKHDEVTLNREQQADKRPESRAPQPGEGAGARSFLDIQNQEAARPVTSPGPSRSPARTNFVSDENQAGPNAVVQGEGDTDQEATPVAELIAQRRERETKAAESEDPLDPNHEPETGATGKRPHVDGISVPFSIKKEAETASMVTLTSWVDPSGAATPGPSSRPMSMEASEIEKRIAEETGKGASQNAGYFDQNKTEKGLPEGTEKGTAGKETETATGPEDTEDLTPNANATAGALGSTLDVPTPLSFGVYETPLSSPRPTVDRFFTADEDLPKAAANTNA